MGNALAIAAVSRVLRQLVEGNVLRYGLDGFLGGDVFVTAQPPNDDTDRLRINLMLYRTIENPRWRSEGVPAYDAVGQRIDNPPLALDLHYVVSAYAQDDYQSEMLLGCAMQAFHEVPSLDRNLILEVLGQDTGTNTLIESRLAEQIERVRIRHRNVSEDAFSRIWSAFHVPYRASAFYEVSVVLIQQDESPLRVALPVLRRPEPVVNARLTPSTPTLVGISPPNITSGLEATLSGHNLDGTGHRVVGVYQDRSLVLQEPEIEPADVEDHRVSFTIPESWPIGSYELQLSVLQDGVARMSNRLPFLLSPQVEVVNIERAATPPQFVSVEVSVAPSVRAGQPVSFSLGSRSVTGEAVLAETASLTFDSLDVPPGAAPFRLRVDGVDSPWLDTLADSPAFLPAAMVNVP